MPDNIEHISNGDKRIKLHNCLQMDLSKSPLNLKIGVSSCEGKDR